MTNNRIVMKFSFGQRRDFDYDMRAVGVLIDCLRPDASTPNKITFPGRGFGQWAYDPLDLFLDRSQGFKKRSLSQSPTGMGPVPLIRTYAKALGWRYQYSSFAPETLQLMPEGYHINVPFTTTVPITVKGHQLGFSGRNAQDIMLLVKSMKTNLARAPRSVVGYGRLNHDLLENFTAIISKQMAMQLTEGAS